MANHRISNLMPSPLDLSAITDVNGNPITLRPVNTPGASREIAGETTHHEVVQRVVSAGWAKVEKIAVAVAPPAAVVEEPPAPPARVAQPLSDVIETIEAPVEPIVMAAEETPAVETASEVPAEATADVAVEEPAEAAVDVAGEEPAAEVSTTPATRGDDSRRNRRNR